MLNKMKAGLIIYGMVILTAACSSAKNTETVVTIQETVKESDTVSVSQSITSEAVLQESSSELTTSAETKEVSSESIAETSAPAATQNQPAVSEDIGVEKAKEIALERAGLSASAVTFIDAHLDRDDGRLEYDLEFHSGGMEYEVSVDARNGEIREYSSEKHD